MYKGKHVDLPKVARELKVSHVLEGSVRKSGGRVRITAQLINGQTNEHVWADRYDRDLNDIFALQDEISEAIVKALKVKLLPAEKKEIERRGTDNVEAWSLVAEARQYLLSGRTNQRYYRAVIRFCERALALDPNFAEAWATIAHAKDRLRFDCGCLDEDGMDAADRALALDDRIALAHASKARGLLTRGRTDEAEIMITRALQLEPDRPEILKTRASLFFRQGKYREAADYYERVAMARPDDYAVTGMLNSCAGALKDKEMLDRCVRMAIERTEPALAREPDNTDAIGWLVPALAALGQVERVNYWITRARMFEPENFAMNYNFGCSLSRMGDAEQAVEMLVSVDHLFTPESLEWMKGDPDLSAVRNHPRYIALVASLEARLSDKS
jgi:adenylate cyclase